MTDIEPQRKLKKDRNLSTEAKPAFSLQKPSKKPSVSKPPANPYAFPGNLASDYPPYLDIMARQIPKQNFNKRCILPSQQLRSKESPSSQKGSRNMSADHKQDGSKKMFTMKNDYLLLPYNRPSSQAWGYVGGQASKGGLRSKNERRTLTRQQHIAGIPKCESKGSTKKKLNRTSLLDDMERDNEPELAFNNTFNVITTTSKEVKAKIAKSRGNPFSNPIRITHKVPRISTHSNKPIRTPPSDVSIQAPKSIPAEVAPIMAAADPLISFCASKNQLGTNQNDDIAEELERAAKIRPYAMIMDEVKPMFFFNVKPKQEDTEDYAEEGKVYDFSTPSFVESFREAADAPIDEKKVDQKAEKQKQCPFKPLKLVKPFKVKTMKQHQQQQQHTEDECSSGAIIDNQTSPVIKMSNEQKGNIFINKTTIINNIINSSKRQVVKKQAIIPKHNDVLGAQSNGKLSKSFVTGPTAQYCI